MAISKIILNTNGTDVTQIDLTQDTVEASVLMSSYTAHDAAGLPVVGSASGGGGFASGEITFASETNIYNEPYTITHNLGKTPTYIFLWVAGWLAANVYMNGYTLCGIFAQSDYQLSFWTDGFYGTSVNAKRDGQPFDWTVSSMPSYTYPRIFDVNSNTMKIESTSGNAPSAKFADLTYYWVVI